MHASSATQNTQATLREGQKKLPFGFNLIFLTCLLITVLSFLPSFMYALLSYLYCSFSTAVQGLQVWRLFLSFLLNGVGLQGVYILTINLSFLYFCMPRVQRRLSTVYVLIDILLQTLFNNIVLIAVEILLSLGFDYQGLVGYSLYPILFNYLWINAISTSDQNGFLNLSNRITVWFILLLLVIFSTMSLICIVGCFCGYLQYVIFKRTVFRLPLSFYRRLDALLPSNMTNSESYVKVSQVEAQLKVFCEGTIEWLPQNVVQNDQVAASEIIVSTQGPRETQADQKIVILQPNSRSEQCESEETSEAKKATRDLKEEEVRESKTSTLSFNSEEIAKQQKNTLEQWLLSERSTGQKEEIEQKLK